MIGYLAFRTARGVALGIGPIVMATLAIGLALTFWYVTLPVAALALGIAYAYRRRVLADNTAKRQAVVDAENLASARARADRKGLAHQSVYANR